MNKPSSLSFAFIMAFYSLAWVIALPFLLFLKGLRPISRHRFGLGMPKGPFDLWIQAASVGEAKLALKLLSHLPANRFPRIIISCNTIQGMDTLKNKIDGRAQLVFFPFDISLVWAIALARTQPKQMLLMETEIWPALLFNCKRRSIPVIIGNGRMSLKSFCRYYPLSAFLNKLGPDRILAVSEREKQRFSWIFRNSQVGLMPNIKFDIISSVEPIPYIKNPLSSYFKPGHPLIVLGSIRQEEEHHIQWLIKKISFDHPRTTIALFPRHMKRIDTWEKFLNQNNISWNKRSRIQKGSSLPGVILWDKFGEMLQAYAMAKSAFVGGSLAPCGGQNFLEPLSQGVIPCVGPFWDNFYWVGEKILYLRLVCQVADEHQLYSRLINPSFPSRIKVLSDFKKYVDDNKGGTAILINNLSR